MAPPGVAFKPNSDIPDLSNKVIVLTGGTAGLGAQIVKTLATHRPRTIFFTGRNGTAATKLIESINEQPSPSDVRFIECDQSSFAFVKNAASRIQSQTDHIDILFCNAGVMSLPPGLTKDGYELQFGINHMAHALLTQLLLPWIKRSPGGPRIIISSSQGMGMSPPLDFSKFKTDDRRPFVPSPIGPGARYAVTKLCNVLYASELARHHPEILTVSVHPGVIMTGLVTNLGWSHRALISATTRGQQLSEEEGSFNQLWAATANREDLVNGKYYEPVGILGKQTKQSGSEKLAMELWQWTEKELEDWVQQE
ncbi:MAG: hypothetical protein M1828_001246 [Chrysothrix sp. TS-e1954]|nr:MAG: hypothetical protein M1828_001246 [Chrysothrix sp. TS-e1954]